MNPSAIIEFTATPRLNSNILHSVTAQELKLEEMIKLPIMLSEHDTWQNAVNGAIAARASLAETAENDPDYIRPIVLFQAQPKNQEVTVEVLKKHLIEVEQITEDKIAVATGDQRELDGINLFDPKSTIEYVITVEALKEGWDCSFAYAFCSVSRIQSAVDVEQLLGRVLRMPYAKRRKAEDLNRAYAFLSEPSFGEAARSLADKLVAMGFEEDEALDNIEPAQGSLDADTGLFGPREKPKPTFRHTVTASPDVIAALKKREGVTVRETESGKVEIAVTGSMDGGLEKVITEALPEVPRYAMYSGCVLDQFTWQMQRSGLLTATARLVAQGETVATTTSAGTPSTLELKRFGHFNGAVTRNGSALGNVVSAEITYANNLDRIETIRSDGRIDGADPSIAALTGSIEVRFADQTLVTQAINGDSCELEFEYSLPSGESFTFTVHAIYLPRPRIEISGPQGVQATFDWQAARDSVVGRMCTAMLNGVVARINGFIGGINAGLAALGSERRISIIPDLDLGQIENRFEGAASAASTAAQDAFNRAFADNPLTAPDLGLTEAAIQALKSAKTYRSAARDLAQGAHEPLESWQALRDAVRDSNETGADALTEATAAAERFEAALGDAGKAATDAGNSTQRAAAAAEPAVDAVATGWQAVTAALSDYASKARDIGDDIGQRLVSAFRSAEDAIGEFVKTGKFNFRDLVTSLIADLAKLAVRRSILGPIAGALGSILGGAGGMFANILHAGGVAGSPAPQRMVPALAFAAAPRMHSGGMAGLRHDEVPAILQRGERVLSRREAAELNRSHDGSPVTIHFNVSTPDVDSFRQSSGQTMALLARAVDQGRRHR